MDSTIVRQTPIEAEIANNKTSLESQLYEKRVILKGGHSPIIGDNGNWLEWDNETQKMIDTGVRAEGKDYILTDADKEEIRGDIAADVDKLKSDLAEIVEKHESVNLFNKDSELLASGKYIQGSGDYLTASGTYVSHPIKVKNGKTYTFNVTTGYYGQNALVVRGVGEDGTLNANVIRATDNGDGTATFTVTNTSPFIIDECYGVVVNVRTPSTMMFVEGTSLPSEYQPYFYYVQIKEELLPYVDNPLYGKKLCVDGDSLMAGAGFSGGFAQIIGDKNSMAVVNNAVGGGTIASETYYSDGVTKRHWICDTIQNIPSDADYILFDGGGNDSSETAEVGTISSGFSAELDTTTFCGAMESICKWLVINRPTAKIGYVIVHKMANNYTSEYPTDGDRDLYGLSIKICKKWGIPYIDMNTQVPPLKDIQSLRDVYTSNADGWHPNELGYRTFYVPKIEAWMKTL